MALTYARDRHDRARSFSRICALAVRTQGSFFIFLSIIDACNVALRPPDHDNSRLYFYLYYIAGGIYASLVPIKDLNC